MTNLREAMARSISRRVAKREFGESYQGYETSHGAAGDDYADAALAAIEAAGFTVVPREATEEMKQGGYATVRRVQACVGLDEVCEHCDDLTNRDSCYHAAVAAYIAMLDAAPKP